MKKIIIIIIILVLAGAIGLASWFYYQNSPEQAPPTNQPPATPQKAEKSGLIIVDQPLIDALVASPLEISGQARGSWYFEASFPVKLYDASGNLLTSTPAQAQGDWMTENFVPFKATLEFSAPATADGYLILEKDNPSGLPQNADELKIPIRFK